MMEFDRTLSGSTPASEAAVATMLGSQTDFDLSLLGCSPLGDGLDDMGLGMDDAWMGVDPDDTDPALAAVRARHFLPRRCVIPVPFTVAHTTVANVLRPVPPLLPPPHSSPPRRVLPPPCVCVRAVQPLPGLSERRGLWRQPGRCSRPRSRDCGASRGSHARLQLRVVRRRHRRGHVPAPPFQRRAHPRPDVGPVAGGRVQRRWCRRRRSACCVGRTWPRGALQRSARTPCRSCWRPCRHAGGGAEHPRHPRDRAEARQSACPSKRRRRRCRRGCRCCCAGEGRICGRGEGRTQACAEAALERCGAPVSLPEPGSRRRVHEWTALQVPWYVTVPSRLE